MPLAQHLRRPWRCRLRLLTPLHMGMGQDAALSPYQDIVSKNGRLYYLSPRKLETALAQKPELIDVIVREMKASMDNNRSNFDLSGFIDRKLQSSTEALAAYSLPIFPKNANIGRNHVLRFAHTGGRPYIPGSGLKGAIRTAMTYTFLNPDAKEPEKSPLVKELKQAAANANQGNKDQRSNLNKKQPDVEVLGKIVDDMMCYLRIGDSCCLPVEKLMVTRLTRPQVFRENGQALPFWAEVLPAESIVEFDLGLQEDRVRQAHSPQLGFLKEGRVQPLLDALNQFAAEACSRERGEMEAFAMQFDAYEQVENLLKTIQDDARYRPHNVAYLRLGWGKTYFENSIGLAMEDELGEKDQQPTFWAFRKALRIGEQPKSKKYASDFPAMRTYTTSSAKSKTPKPEWPLGWVKLEVL